MPPRTKKLADVGLKIRELLILPENPDAPEPETFGVQATWALPDSQTCYSGQRSALPVGLLNLLYPFLCFKGNQKEHHYFERSPKN